MDIQSYCDLMGHQLTGWKSKINEVILTTGKLPAQQRDGFNDSLRQLNSLLIELDQCLGRLETECPIEWAEKWDTVDEKLGKMRLALSQLSDRVGLPDSIAWI